MHLSSDGFYGVLGGAGAKTGQKTGQNAGQALTDSRIKALGRLAVTGGRDIKTKDATTRGLVLHSAYTGAQTWRYRYTDAAGSDKVVKLGDWPKMSLAQARQKAIDSHAAVKAGEDVQQTKAAARRLFCEFLDAFYARWEVGKRAGSIEVIKPKVDLLKERLGSVPVEHITTGRIAAALEGLPASTAQRCLHVTQQALRIAVVQNAVKTNVARELKSTDINSAPKERVPRTAVSLEDLPAVVAKVAERSQTAADALRIVALCATRIEETVTMEWAHIDWVNKLWEIPAENRKGKLEIRHGLIVPLSNAALAVLREIAGRKLSDRWVFVGNMGHCVDRRTVLANLKRADATATVHGFRKLFSTTMNEAGFDAYVIEAALGHVTKGVAGVYNKATYLTQRRELMDAWSAHLDSLAAQPVAMAAD